MSQKIVAIQVNTNPVRWVLSTYKKENGKRGVEYTDDKNQAKDYRTEEAARDATENFDNPCDRVFKPMPLEVSRPQHISEFFADMN